MICLPYRRTSRLVVALLILGGARVSGQTQTPGQVTKFDPSLNVVDSVITENPSGNIGIGTFTPFAKLDVFGGNLNLENSTEATGNILKGGALFLHNFGTENTFIGIGAGNLTTTGSGNNTAIGIDALHHNQDGAYNTATGVAALHSNTTGGFNTASGTSALQSNTSGSVNTASGYLALQANTTGSGNTASGSEALWQNSSGYFNTASGRNALRNNTSGFGNTVDGAFALFYSQGSGNTAMGAQALDQEREGNYNTAVGFAANVPELSTLNNATAIGAFAIVNASNKIRLGNDQVTVIEGQVPYTFVSDRNQKENFQPVDGEDVLKKVGGLNLTSWNYIGHDPQQFRHYGPVAQEFFAAFGQDAVGTIGTSTTINSGDLEGILMAAVQALEKRTAENADLRARIEALEKLVKGTTTQH